jgi:gas vesicle protein
MYYDEENGLGGFIAGLLIGAVVGVSVALLVAPQSGSSTRHRLIRAVAPGRWRGGDADEERKAAVRSGRRRAGR